MRILLMSVALFCFVGSTSAVLIDFEAEGAALGEGALLPTVGVANFSVFGPSIAPGVAPRLAAPGGANRGFANPAVGSDTPDPTSPLLMPGNHYFLTNGSQSNNNTGNYAVDFSSLVDGVSLQLYDYRADGDTQDGIPGSDSVDFIGYLGGNVVDTMNWIVPNPRPNDGNIVQLALQTGSVVDRVEVVFNGIDLGTGIDNLTYNVVPEPASATVLFCGLLGILGLRRR